MRLSEFENHFRDDNNLDVQAHATVLIGRVLMHVRLSFVNQDFLLFWVGKWEEPNGGGKTNFRIHDSLPNGFLR